MTRAVYFLVARWEKAGCVTNKRSVKYVNIKVFGHIVSTVDLSGIDICICIYATLVSVVIERVKHDNTKRMHAYAHHFCFT